MAKSSNTGEPKTRRAPARRRTDKATPAAPPGQAAEMSEAASTAPEPPRHGDPLAGQVPPAAGLAERMESRTMESRPSAEEVRRRAFALYLERGRRDGHDMEDWLEAERQLRGQ